MLDDWFTGLGGLVHVHANIHRSPMPFSGENFRALHDAGIRVIFSMEEAVALAEPHIRGLGFDWRPHFWVDDHPPKPEEVDRFLAEYAAVPDDVPTVMHCRAGWGRAGTAITCALVAKHGFSADDALRHYWSRVPRAERIMTGNGQADFVRGYAARIRGRGLP